MYVCAGLSSFRVYYNDSILRWFSHHWEMSCVRRPEGQQTPGSSYICIWL